MGGEAHFVQDHFEPKHRPNVNPADYSNLYWCCAECNSRANKGTNWPSPADVARGDVFCDPCQNDPVGADYVEDGELLSQRTPAGSYTIDIIRLNERDSLRKIRRNRKRVRETYVLALQVVRAALYTLDSQQAERASEEDTEKYRKLSMLVDSYEFFVSREPFLLTNIPREIPADVIEGLWPNQ